MKVSVHTIRATGIPWYLLPAFSDGRRTAGILENIVAAALTAEVTSMDDEHEPDLLLKCGSVCEVRAKAATSKNSWSTKTSLESRGANGKGGSAQSDKKWSQTDRFAIVRYAVEDTYLLVHVCIIDCKSVERRPKSISQKQFQTWVDTLPHTTHTL